MRDQDLFEARLHAAIGRYAAEVTSDLDPVTFAHAVATRQSPRRARWLAWPWRVASTGGVGWLLVLAVLLAIIAGAIGVGAFRRLPAAPFGLTRPGLIAVDLGGRIVLTEADESNPRDIPGGCPFHPRCTVARPECTTTDVELWSAGDARRAACVRVLDGAPR